MTTRRHFFRPGRWLAALLAGIAGAHGADVIYRNGPILTLGEAHRQVEALAVRGDTILAVGSLAEVSRQADRAATVVDLQGRTLLPGFYAAHDHFLSASLAALYQVDLNSPPIGRIESIDDIVAALRARAAASPAGQWIVGRGYDDTLIREQRHPTRHDLDRASREHPIWIVHTSGHLGVANSRALALARIGPATPHPANGVIHRDPGSKEPNGVFEECGSLVARHLPARNQAERLEALRQAGRRYLAKGVTTTVVAGGGKAAIDDFRRALADGLVDLRFVVMLSSGASVPATSTAAAAWNGPGEQLRVGAAKLWQDGSIQGYTGHLAEPYHRQPPGKEGYRGYPMRSREALEQLVVKYHRGGYQVAIHGNGDATIDDILRAFAAAQHAQRRPDARHRIEHCQTAREDQLATMARLGVTPSFFNGHVYYWGDRHRDIFLGPERAARISPLRSASRHGLRYTLHNDSPVTPVDPLLLVWTAVNRTTRDGQTLGPEQRVDVLTALRAVTSDAAWQNFEEQRKGTLAPGKLADLVILAENPLTVPPARLKDLAVLETIVGGRSAYRR